MNFYIRCPFKWTFREFINITRLFEDISREMEASVKKCGAFIKISTIFEDFFREIEAFSRIASFLNTFLLE
jgi:hypothetical protein